MTAVLGPRREQRTKTPPVLCPAGRFATGFIVASALATGAAAQNATIVGSLSARGGEPLGFGTVAIEALGRSQFTNDAGRFALYDVPAGRHVLLVRRLGFAPIVDTVDVRAGVSDTLRYQLARLAVTLRSVEVRAYPPCLKPGPPPRGRDSVLADVLEQVRINADQYRLLIREYPFEYTMRSVRTNRMRNGRTALISRKDVPLSSTSAAYEPGHVIRQRGPAWYFSIPTLSELADTDFLQFHCWYFLGAEQVDSSVMLRVDLVAFDSLTTPDVNGSIYLDLESFQIRRTVLHLSRRFEKKMQMVDMAVTTDFREVLPSVPVVSRVLSVQTMDPDARVRVAETVEEQTLRVFRFTGRKPGDLRRP